MGKKGVILDNGRNAQSSMALYWRKNKQQQGQPKKKYEPTQEEQLQQRVETGFQKWKLHKEKMISKAYEKKEKTEGKASEVQRQVEEEEEEIQKPLGPMKIPGFKSKDQLERRLKAQQVKQVSQKDNVLHLPSHMQGLTQEDIIQILREKKAKKQMEKKKKNQQAEEEDVMLGEDFLSTFKTQPQKKRQEEERLKRQEEQRIEAERKKQQKEKHFFKSDILNQISQGNTSVLSKQPPTEQNQVEKMEAQVHSEKEQAHQSLQKHLFKPRVLGQRK